MIKFWLALLSPALALGAPATTNPPSPPKIIQLSVPLNGRAAIEVHRAGLPGPGALKGVVALPQDFDPRRSWPVLLVTAPSGSSAVRSVSSYTNVALAHGWVVAAVDGPKVSTEQDNNVFAWAMISSLLDQLRLSWPQSKQWPFACAGFSGGAKRAAMTAAEMMRQRDVVIGVFMGGCNEDRATLGYQISRPGQAFLDVLMYLSNGTGDPIAGVVQGAAVKQSMEQTGFRRIRLETYDGQHRLDTNQLRMALEWFRPREKNALNDPPGRLR
jgi:hypothetical protein